MESIEGIKKSLQEEVEEEKEKILKEAEMEAEEIKSKAQKEADKEADEIIEEGEREADGIYKKIISSARMEARRNKLNFKDEMSESVFKDARDELLELKENQEEYEETMENLIRDGGISIGGGDIEVLVPEGDNFFSEDQIKEIEKDISEDTGEDTSIELREDLDESTGGPIVKKSDGTVQCDNTFEARLMRMKDSLRTEIIKTLFEEE